MCALAVGCEDKRDHGPAVQPNAPTVGYSDDAASAVAKPATAIPAEPVTGASPAPPVAPPAPSGTVAVEPTQPTAVQPTPPIAPAVTPNILLLSGAVGPKATELSHPEGSPNAAEARADLNARVVRDAGVVRYELYATAPAPWVVKSTTPFNLSLRPSNGARMQKTIFTRSDFANPDAPVKQINAEIDAGPGEYSIDASAELYVCSAELCKRVNEKLRTEFTIPKS